MEKVELTRRDYLVISLLAFSGQVAWAVENQYYNVFLYNAIAPIPLYVSYMVAASAIVATLTSIFMGSLSDVLGKRKIFLIIGYSLWALTTAIFPLAALFRPIVVAVTTAILFDCIMTFFGSTAYDATFNAYVTDITTLENRGKAMSIVEIMTLLAVLITYGASGFIIESYGYFIYFYIVGVLVGSFGVLGAILAREPELESLNISVWEHIKSTFRREEIGKYRDYFLVLSTAGLWGMAFNVFFPFIIIYLQHYIGLGLAMASFLMFIVLLIAIIISFPIGVLTDKIGRKKLNIIAIIGESISLILFSLSKTLLEILITGVMWIAFMVVFDISNGTWIKDLYPETKRGQFSGYFILFTVLFTMVPGPLIGGWLASRYGIPIEIDGQRGYIPTPIIFTVAGILVLLALIPALMAKETKEKI